MAQQPDPSAILEKMRPFSRLEFHQFTTLLDHFNMIIQQKKLMEMFKSFEINPESEKLLELHGMLHSKHLATWIRFLEALPTSDESGSVLKQKVLQKLNELFSEMPADNSDSLENKEFIEKIEKDFENSHGFIAAPRAHIAPENPGFFENFEIPANVQVRNETEHRMLMIIGRIDMETDEEVERLTEQEGVPEDDGRVLEQLTRKYRNKLLEIKYFAVLPF